MHREFISKCRDTLTTVIEKSKFPGVDSGDHCRSERRASKCKTTPLSYCLQLYELDCGCVDFKFV